MQIISDLDAYLVLNSSPLADCLLKIDANKSGTVFVVDNNRCLVGVLSDGDFRRWLTNSKQTDLSIAVSEAMNTQFTACLVDSSTATLAMSFKDSFNLLPLVDTGNRLKAIAIKGLEGISIDGHLLSQTTPTYIVAELGNNHNGSLKHAKELVDAAAAANADCVKFQMRDMASVYKNQGQTRDDSADLGAQYVFDLLEKFQLSNDELIEAFDYCKSLGVTPLCTPWDQTSLAVLEGYGMPAYKVASADFTNLPLLKAMAETNKPLLCSTGMCTETEIIQSVDFLNQHATQFVLLHCNSTYPAPLKDVNLRYLERLKQIGGGLVGYSGHELGVDTSVAAVAMGARVIEKHFTLDKGMEGNDHKVSLLPNEFAQMVQSIRNIETALGNASERSLSQGEMMNRETLAKSLIAKTTITKGERITREMIEIKSPGQGLQPYLLPDLLGKAAVRDIDAGDFFFQTDIDGAITEARNYYFDRPFGIPVRYHDYAKLSDLSNLDFVEFHLSYQDLEVDIDSVFDEPQGLGLAVHAPELFAGDHIIDLASKDKSYLKTSRANLQQTIAVTQKLKSYFPATKRPVIVLNAGGFTEKSFMAADERPALYQQIAKQLGQVDQEGVEVIVQTMPPFPWHFGGQRYHNLFVDPNEIVQFCKQNKMRICLDISHSMMACNYYGWSLNEFIDAVGPYTAHLHISDALGDSGEGVQMGEGNVDFLQLGQSLAQHVPNVMFIPEIWQGHKNRGEGFWQAFEHLEPNMAAQLIA